MSKYLQGEECDVAIIGGGPTGLAAAITLKNNGITKVIVLDREPEAGGIPRHCGHPPFGFIEFKKIMTGPSYAKQIVKNAIEAGVEIRTSNSVQTLGRDGKLTIVSSEGIRELQAQKVILATGTRETPRSARFISGRRPLGICNTGALQSMVYLNNRIPFKSPIIIGSEIVAFSALFTCKKAGIKPVAMIEENNSTSVMWPMRYAAYLAGVPLFTGTRLTGIDGQHRVESIQTMDSRGLEKEIDCDGVLFTGKFTPEASLARMSHLEIDELSGSPMVDKYGRCSDPSYHAAGNVLNNPVKIAGKCWQAGQLAAKNILTYL